ncbi:MAG: magnetochrome domain-containing protein [Magnetococcales bacterium]|nr:magnetochrome domain-containing protein [Magnetococcales bacterium]
MNRWRPYGGGILLLAFIAVGLVWGDRLEKLLPDFPEWWTTLGNGKKTTPQLMGEVFGSMPKPTQPAMTESVIEAIKPSGMQKVVVKRIPTIEPGSPRPHDYWGECNKCHLFRGGPPPGSQPITPVGKMWEKTSASITKVGPYITPDSPRPHPPAGRCIKCHDIVIEKPV